MVNEITYSTPNGVQFKISVLNGVGKWHCMECGQDGNTTHDSGDDAEEQARFLARQHSVICGAGRGTMPK